MEEKFLSLIKHILQNNLVCVTFDYKLEVSPLKSKKIMFDVLGVWTNF